MVFTSRVQSTLFSPTLAPTSSNELIRLPLTVAPQYETRCETTGKIIPTAYKPLLRSNLWTSDEHERFLHGLELFPNGPWKEVANVVGTKTTRQTMTHAQKYRQKIERRKHTKRTTQPHAQVKCVDSDTARTTTKSLHFREVLYGALHATAPAAASSPSDPCGDVFDTSFLDDEFEALLSSLDPEARMVDAACQLDWCV